MAVIDFPASPILGDEHTDDLGITWICENETGPIWGPKLTREQLATLDIELESASVVDVKIYIPSLHDYNNGDWLKNSASTFPSVSAFVLEIDLLSIYDISSETPILIKTFTVTNAISIVVLNGFFYVASSTLGVDQYDITNNYLITDLSPLISSDVVRKINVIGDANGDNIIGVATADQASIIFPDDQSAEISDYIIDGCHEITFISDKLVAVSSDTRRIVIGTIDRQGMSITLFDLYNESAIPAVVTAASWLYDLVHAKDHLIARTDVPVGFMRLFIDEDDQVNGMVAYTDIESFSGIMYGDIKGAFLANSKLLDRSVNGNVLTEVGTITESAVVSGAELMGYSGFSGTVYFEQAYNADFDFGLNTFSMAIHVYRTAVGTLQYILKRGDTDGYPEFRLVVNSSNEYQFDLLANDTSIVSLTSVREAALNKWELVETKRIGTSLLILIDGIVTAAGTFALKDISSVDSSAKLKIGSNTAGSPDAWSGALSLLRISGGAPSSEQSLLISNKEKSLFIEDSKCTLQGTSSIVNTIDYDPIDDIVAVPTDNYITKFKGLVVVEDSNQIVDSISIAADKEILGVI